MGGVPCLMEKDKVRPLFALGIPKETLVATLEDIKRACEK